MEQLLAHLAGDYLFQSRWMATFKVERWWPAVVHGVVYTLPFLLLTTEFLALAVIGSTHILIDRFRLGKLLQWLVDRIGPRDGWTSWTEFRDHNGGKPEYLHFWLMVINDNTLHLLINFFALKWWG